MSIGPFVVGLQTPAVACETAGVCLRESHMQFVEIIANLLAALLLTCVVAIVYSLAGRPLWPEREAKMVILFPPDVMTTASVGAPTHLRLPDTFDTRLLQSRPEQDQ